jgi:hypothetical protein
VKATKGTARLAGALYVLLGVAGFYSLKIVPSALVVSGDAAATARNIAAHEFTYRLAIYSGLVGEALFLFLGLTLYALFRDVGRSQARLMLTLVLIAAVLGVFDLSFQAAPLVLLSGAGYLSPFTQPQLAALAMGLLRLHIVGVDFSMLFWGLWLLPFGILVIRSGYLPRVLGWLLIINGFAWIVVGGASVLFPAHAEAVDKIMTPFYSVGEMSTMLWLLIMGAKVPAQSVPEAA